MRSELGDANVDAFFVAYRGLVRPEADLVCYWFARAWQQIANGDLSRAGLVSTNSIRGGANREVLKPIAENGRIFAAWGDEAWTVDGAAVRVSLVCFDGAKGGPALLDGTEVAEVYADLAARRSDGGGVDLTKAVRLRENRSVAFMGDTKGGSFDIPGDRARDILLKPVNPNGRPNSDVLRPWMNGMDITRRPSDKWIIDFGWTMTEGDAALYEEPFRHCLLLVKPERDKNRREAYRLNWWRHVEARQGMWAAVGTMKRWIVTPEVSKHRVFAWLDTRVCPDHKLQVIARDDDTCFGILASSLHLKWSLAVGSWHGVGNDPRYTISTCFQTFPFPEGLTPNIPAASYAADPRAQAIAVAAARLNELRENWLNPPDLVSRVPEVVPGYRDRILPRDDKAAQILKTRTLTNLYNQRPAWLDHAHKALDHAVAEAYGWGDEWQGGKLTDDEILARLFRLNQARAAKP